MLLGIRKIKNTIKKRIAISLVFALTIGNLGHAGFFGAQVEAEAATKTICMTEVYNEGNYGVGVSAGDVVTIASKEELVMFRKYVEAGNPTQSITFCQAADIVMSNYTFEYNPKNERVGFYLDGEFLGAVERNGGAYTDYVSEEKTSLEALAIETENQSSWEPIGNEEEIYFKGVYNGNGHAIEGLWCVTTSYTSAGLFDYICGDICNLTIKDSMFIGAEKTGAIAGCMIDYEGGSSRTITNCSVDGIVVGGSQCGGLIGEVQEPAADTKGRIINSSVQGIISGNTGDVGGCVGKITQGEISYCEFLGEESKVFGTGNVGGIVGSGGSDINNCRNYGKLIRGISTASQNKWFGGIVGNQDVDTDILQCENYGEFCYYGGGIVGLTKNGGRILRCVNYGSPNEEITQESYEEYTDDYTGEFGGIVWETQCYYEGAWILDCENRGSSISKTKEAGGIVHKGAYGTKVLNCINRGKLWAENTRYSTGGIIGKDGGTSREDFLIQNCVTIEAYKVNDNESYQGAICGHSDVGSIKNCYYPQGDMGCAGTSSDVDIEDCYAVTQSQLRGTEQTLRISEEEGSYGNTTSVVEALNNAVADLNETYAQTEWDGKFSLQEWDLDEEGFPCLSNLGVDDKKTENPPFITVPEVTIPPVTTSPAISSPTVVPTLQVPSAAPSQIPSETPSETILPTATVSVTYSAMPTLPTDTSPSTKEPAKTNIPSETSPTKTNIPLETSPANSQLPEETEPTKTNAPVQTILPIPDGTEENVPTTTPSEKISLPTNPPSVTESPVTSPQVNDRDESAKYQNKVSGLQIQMKGTRQVKLSWKPVKNSSWYEIYRSTQRNLGYKRIKIVVEKNTWTDKTVKKGRKYFYKIRAGIGMGENFTYGAFSFVKRIKLPWCMTPKVTYTKGVAPNNEKCLFISLKQYEGTHVEIYVRKKGEKYQPLLLRDNRIKSYQGVFCLTYSKGGQSLFCKVRTYSYQGKKKRYSRFTKTKKVRL